MTPKEALQIIWGGQRENGYQEMVDAHHLLQELVKKNMPLLVSYRQLWFYCPSCQQLLGGSIMRYHQHCFKCGQALKWPDRIE